MLLHERAVCISEHSVHKHRDSPGVRNYIFLQARKSQLEINIEVEVVQAVVDVDGLFGSVCLSEKNM